MSRKRFALSAKVVVRDEEGRCLLLKRSMRSKNNRGKWDLPGGKVDPGEDFEEALLREVVEETGLTVSLEGVAGAGQSELPDRIVVYIVLEGRRVAGEVRLSSEHDAFAWAAPADVPGMDICPQFRMFAEAPAAGDTALDKG